MLIERQIEEIIKSEIANVVSDCSIVGSWSPSDSGMIKTEFEDKTNKALISIFVEPRQHDSFSLPTVNISGTIAIDARCELCPTMQEVSEIFESIINLLNHWHYSTDEFSDTFSTDDFFATEIMLNGGSRVAFDR